MKYRYGHFTPEGTEFIVTNPDTPRAFDNFLWNKAVFSNVQQTGVGYFDYQIGDLEGIQFFTGVGRICDFDVYGRDHLMSRLIYVRDNDSGEFWNVGWEPVCKDYTSYDCTHGLGYTTIKSETEGVLASFRIFVPPGDDPVELWSLRLENHSGRERNLSIYVYNQIQFAYKWGYDSYGDMFYRHSWWDKDLNSLVANKHPYYRPHDFLVGFMAADVPIIGFEGTRDAFIGTYSNLKSPRAVVEGKCTNTPGSSDATIMAAQFDMALGPGNVESMEIIVGATDNEQKIAHIQKKYFGQFEVYIEALHAEKEAMINKIRYHTPDEYFNHMFNGWIKQGAAYGATWCRWGWMGFRDIVQHGYGISPLNPVRTREILLQALQHQYSNGLAVRGWNPVDEKPYSDSALWMVFTLTAYLKETGDLPFLDEVIEFFDGGNGTVLDHIERTLDFLEANKGSHDLCLIKFGDWNDSLTAVGKDGRGESVMLSQMYAEALREISVLFEFLGEKEKQQEYFFRRTAMLEAINTNAWDGRWYTRCFDDDGRPIGSHVNQYGQMFLESQAWGLISGAADQARADTLLQACDDILGTPLGYRLLTPTYCEIDDNIGRISSMEPGICENGTIYSHLNVWMMMGLLRMGKADEALELFRKNAPGYRQNEHDLRQMSPPYMFANNYYGPDHRNKAFQMEFTWITGSLAWFNNVFLGEMFGVKPDYRGLIIDPCLPSEWQECSIKRSFRGATYDIHYFNLDGIQKGDIEVTLDGDSIAGNSLPFFEDGQTHDVKVLVRPKESQR
jgi:cellobiose phosphorylase